jgi:hypothetical protein
MARSLYVNAYIRWATEVDPAPTMGGSWDEMAPNTAGTRKASMQAARELVRLIDQQTPLANLFEQGIARSGGRRQRGHGTEADLAYAYGEALAQICMGVMDPGDSVLPLPSGFRAPRFQVELDDDGRALSWDGGESWHENPSRGCHCAHKNPAGGPAVLLLEDDPRTQQGTTRWVHKLFGKDNIHVVVADNVPAAIANLGVHNVKLIVSDVDVLGDQNGVDFFHYVKDSRPDLLDRFIFFTGGHPEVAQLHSRYLEKGGATFEDFKAVYRGTGTTIAPPVAASRARTTVAPPPAPIEMSMPEFADAVTATFPTIREEFDAENRFRGRVGGRKVFVGAIWRALRADPRLGPAGIDAFKRRLVEANRDGYLVLARADSLSEFDPAELAESLIVDKGHEFHFVVNQQARF